MEQCNTFNFSFKPELIFDRFWNNYIQGNSFNLAIDHHKRLQISSRIIVVAKNTIFRVKYRL
jgi:hypothetical protein